MAAAHFLLESRYDVFAGEGSLLFGDDDLESEVQEQVAQLVTELSVVTRVDGVDDFVSLLEEVAAEGSGGLGRVPRAVGTKKFNEPKGLVEDARGAGKGWIYTGLRVIHGRPILRRLC